MEERESQEDPMKEDVDIEARLRMIKGIAGLLSDDMRLAGNIQAAAEAIFEFASQIEKDILMPVRGDK